MYNIITPSGYAVYNGMSFKEAFFCKRDLTKIDKSKGTYEEDYYKIIPVNNSVVCM